MRGSGTSVEAERAHYENADTGVYFGFAFKALARVSLDSVLDEELVAEARRR